MSKDKLDTPDLANDSVFERFDVPIESPVAPVQLTLDDTIQFNCHKGISCFNACCSNIEFTLTPYDILRLSRRLGLTTSQCVAMFGKPYDLDPHGMPGLKMKPVEGGTACQFMTEEGCGVYEDRPTACRYYAMGTMGMRRKDSELLEDIYFMVNEPHCKGHEEPNTLTVREYRQEQGVEEYDDLNREWLDVIVKKRSAGPTVGAPSGRSFQLFYLASYDLDGFRKFTQSEGFNILFDLDEDTRKAVDEDDKVLLNLAMRYLKQVLFGEMTIPLKEGAAEERYEQRKEVIQQKHQEAVEKYRLRDPSEGTEEDD